LAGANSAEESLAGANSAEESAADASFAAEESAAGASFAAEESAAGVANTGGAAAAGASSAMFLGSTAQPEQHLCVPARNYRPPVGGVPDEKTPFASAENLMA